MIFCQGNAFFAFGLIYEAIIHLRGVRIFNMSLTWRPFEMSEAPLTLPMAKSLGV
jgi:hypothetical protein